MFFVAVVISVEINKRHYFRSNLHNSMPGDLSKLILFYLKAFQMFVRMMLMTMMMMILGSRAKNPAKYFFYLITPTEEQCFCFSLDLKM